MRAPEITHIKIKHGRCNICGHYGDDCTGERYPEHARLKAIQEYSQSIGEFLEWLQVEDGIRLVREHEHSPACYDEDDRRQVWPLCELGDGQLIADYEAIDKRLARYFGIDQNKLETEKREMLAEMRMAHAEKKIRQELAL